MNDTVTKQAAAEPLLKGPETLLREAKKVKDGADPVGSSVYSDLLDRKHEIQFRLRLLIKLDTDRRIQPERERKKTEERFTLEGGKAEIRRLVKLIDKIIEETTRLKILFEKHRQKMNKQREIDAMLAKIEAMENDAEEVENDA